MSNFKPEEHFMNLKGKDYLQVMWRLVWFREEKPNWCIDTEAHTLNDAIAIFNAKIYDENGVQKASGYGSETPKDFHDYIEKAETKAIGRALAILGYGTQFAPELDEGERIVDSPVQRKEQKKEEPKPKKKEAPKEEPKVDTSLLFICENCGKVLTPHTGERGNEYGVRQISEITKNKYDKILCWDCACDEGKKRKAAENG